MLRLFVVLLGVLSFTSDALATNKDGEPDTYTHGYTKKDGTYVDPYYKTHENKTKDDNYGTKGNYNPYTGEKGTKQGDDPYGSSYGHSGSKKKNPYGY